VTNLLTIASLTLREAVRRRVVAAVAILTVLALGLTAWGMNALYGAMLHRGDSTVEIHAAFSVLVLLLAYMFSIVLGVGAALAAAPAIGSDVESGVVLAILPRPLRRAEFVLGKWLALALLVAVYAFLGGLAELQIVRAVSGYWPPHPFLALSFLAAESLVLLTLALLLGTRLAPLAAAIVAVVLFGLGWISGVAQSVALTLRNDAVIHVTTAFDLILPTDAMWRSAAYALEPAVLSTAALADTRREAPFIVGSPPPEAFVWWTASWLLVVLAVAVMSFQRRDL
jgi:ABC-type transport system involved in multi-copper enzyme maturation permease subunit